MAAPRNVMPLSLWRVFPKASPTVRDIAETVAIAHGFTIEDILSRRQKNGLREARFAAYAACRAAGFSYLRIGTRLGRDHSSVMHGERRHSELREAIHA